MREKLRQQKDLPLPANSTVSCRRMDNRLTVFVLVRAGFPRRRNEPVTGCAGCQSKAFYTRKVTPFCRRSPSALRVRSLPRLRSEKGGLTADNSAYDDGLFAPGVSGRGALGGQGNTGGGPCESGREDDAKPAFGLLRVDPARQPPCLTAPQKLFPGCALNGCRFRSRTMSRPGVSELARLITMYRALTFRVFTRPLIPIPGPRRRAVPQGHHG
jgi:hypothetical protein